MKPLHLTLALSMTLVVATAATADPGRNPFAFAPSGAERNETTGAIRVDLVIVAKAYRRGVVNGETVAVGDRVGDATVVGIEPGEILLRANGVTLRYPVGGR